MAVSTLRRDGRISGAPDASEGSPEPSPAASPTAILVVNDNRAARLTLGVMLAPLGHVVVEADSGSAALRAVLRETFAVILMDVRMPTLDGYETAKLIRQRDASARTPIVFVSAFGRDEMQSGAAYASGAVDFIFTPILPDVLRAKVSALVALFTQAQDVRRSLDSITMLNAALRDSEARALTVLQNVADGIVTADEDGVIESFNLSARRLFGYREDEIIGRSLDVLVAPGRRDELRCFVRVGGEVHRGSVMVRPLVQR